MISRYSRAVMVDIWSDTNRFKIWLEVETLALEGLAKVGLAPKDAVKAMREKGNFDTNRVLEIENEVKHDVIAFLTNVAEYVGPLSRFTHRGMTSNDLLDTSFAVQLKQAGKILLEDIDSLLLVLKQRATEFKYTPTIGRSHGIHAEPTTFGLKLLSWYAEIKRQRERFVRALSSVSVGKIAGAVGTYSNLPPEVETYVMGKLGLGVEPVPSQIVHRDRHAEFFLSLAQIATSVERFAVEIRHLQRTEVRECEEFFAKGQKGSSAMPHKRNPILSENVVGLARLIRSYANTALENVVLWHERDISHSSAERVIAPDATIALDFLMTRFTKLVKELNVYPEQMLKNLELTRGLIFSGSLLLALVDKGMLREDAYRLVQKHALPAWEGGEDFKERVKADKEVTSLLTQAEIETAFSLDTHFRHVDYIFERTLVGEF